MGEDDQKAGHKVVGYFVVGRKRAFERHLIKMSVSLSLRRVVPVDWRAVSSYTLVDMLDF
jgi:hypothetical protein